MTVHTLMGPGGATEAKQDTILAGLDALLSELTQKLEAGQQVALDPATLAALESITAAISGTVALDGPTLAALENVTAAVSNLPDEYPLPATQVASLAPQTDALTDVELRASPVPVGDGGGSLTVDGTVALDAGTVAALEQITATVSNWLAEYPLPAAQVAALAPQTDALTEAQLRAADVDVADSGEREYLHVVATVTANGDTTVHSPAAGKAIRLRWIYAINDPSSTNPPLIKVSLGGDEIYRVWALSKRQRVTGPVDGPLVINLSGGGSVAVTALLEEI